MTAPQLSEDDSVVPASLAGALLTQHIDGIIRGDDGARRWLHETFAPRLRRRLQARYARQRGLDADDICQDAFLFFLPVDIRATR